jgi:hypothetical protein
MAEEKKNVWKAFLSKIVYKLVTSIFEMELKYDFPETL